ncbi:hypothetical protein Tco_0264214 [Tanacetum coccineum]
MHNQPLGRKRKIQRLALPKAPSVNRNLLESLFNQRNQCSRLQTQTCHKIKKGIWVIMKMSQGIRLPLYVTGSRNLHHLKNPLTLTGILARLLKGTRSNYAELEYEFKECYKDLSEKLD